MKVKDSEEIVENIGVLAHKFNLVADALPKCVGELTDAQEARLIEQINDLLTRTNRVIKNLILLEENVS